MCSPFLFHKDGQMNYTKLPAIANLIDKSLTMDANAIRALKMQTDYVQAFGYAALLGTGRYSGKSHSWSVLDELNKYISPDLHELPVDELDAKLKSEWVRIQKRKNLASSKSWRDKRKGFSGYYGGKR